MPHAGVPHFALPFRIEASGAAAVIEQDSLDEISQCVRVLVSTRLGERIEVPAYGVRDLVFATDPSTAQMVGAITRWEPRALVALEAGPDSLDELVANIRISISDAS